MTGISLLSSSIIILIYITKRKNKYTEFVRYSCFIYSIIAIIAGLLTLFISEFEGYGSICLGITCFLFAYQDMKEHPVSKWTTAYLSQLAAYFAGLAFILYGIGILGILKWVFMCKINMHIRHKSKMGTVLFDVIFSGSNLPFVLKKRPDFVSWLKMANFAV